MDRLSSVLLDEYMCTKTCPCLHNSQNILRFNNLDEHILNKYRRTKHKTKNATSVGLIPFEWTKDKNKGFESFIDCYRTHLKYSASLNDPNYLDDIFKIN